MLSRVDRTRVINRTRFHEAVREECREYFEALLSGRAELRENFRRRMDAICGFEVARDHFYFAYGSNLAADEIEKTAPGASAVGIAFLPGFRLVFTKHSRKWGGDAATLVECAASVAWGFVYRVTLEERAALTVREMGYYERSLTVWRVDERCRFQDGRPIAAFTFLAKEACPDRCGAVRAYRDLVVEGASSRGLPASYIEDICPCPTATLVNR
jgi:cation transport regulator ChaC